MEQTAAQSSKDSQHPVFRIRENDFSHKPFSNIDDQLDEDLGKLYFCSQNTSWST